MGKIKTIWVTILTMVLFGGLLFYGMTTDWWMTSGRRTPLDYISSNGHEEETTETHEADETSEVYVEEEHETGSVSGSSTVQGALDLGIDRTALEEVLGGSVEDTDRLIKDIATSRGLKFGEIKDALNRLIP